MLDIVLRVLLAVAIVIACVLASGMVSIKIKRTGEKGIKFIRDKQ